MKVRFKTVKLQRCFEHYAEAVRTWGELVARRYVQRIAILQNANSSEDLRKMIALRFHALKGDRDGQFAILLTERYRLIVSFPEKKQESLLVEEVSKHYGD